MPRYRRDYQGSKWFFTVVTASRKRFLTEEFSRQSLRLAVKECQEGSPFEIDAWVLLPDHMHCIWTMDEEDRDFSKRWSIIKRLYTVHFRKNGRVAEPYWQPRFWEHTIRDERDYENHMNYLHYNPVKHGLVKTPLDWPWSSFHRLVKAGIYSPDWGAGLIMPEEVGRE